MGDSSFQQRIRATQISMQFQDWMAGNPWQPFQRWIRGRAGTVA